MDKPDNPTIEFCGVRIFADRQGFRVTGRVVFPYKVGGRTQVPIDYASCRPDGSVDDPELSKADIRQSQKLAVVLRWQALCVLNPGVQKRVLAEQAMEEVDMLRVSYRSIQQWACKLDIEGEDGLRDRYVKPPRAVLRLTPQQASDAVLVCAWWAFRIANVETIDRKMVHTAVIWLTGHGYRVADLLATIDCYYSWSCDRTCYAFKPFARWATHDFPVPWLYRACDENDYRRGLEAAKREAVPLLRPETTLSSSVIDAHMRKREVLHSGTRRAIRDLSDSAVSAPSAVNPRSPSQGPSNTLRTADALRSIGCGEAARAVIQNAAPGIPALTCNDNPGTIAEALGTLEDSYRVMLHKAAQGDRRARDQALATMPLWWEQMPQTIRHNIDFKADAWRLEHPHATDRQAAARRLDVFLPHLRKDRSGAQRLLPAARI